MLTLVLRLHAISQAGSDVKGARERQYPGLYAPVLAFASEF